jgi:hypothetical protein
MARDLFVQREINLRRGYLEVKSLNVNSLCQFAEFLMKFTKEVIQSSALHKLSIALTKMSKSVNMLRKNIHNATFVELSRDQSQILLLVLHNHKLMQHHPAIRGLGAGKTRVAWIVAASLAMVAYRTEQGSDM